MTDPVQTVFGQTTALADAIVAVLNAGSFAVEISAARLFARKFALSSDGTTDLVVPDADSAARVDIFPSIEEEDRSGGGVTPVFEAKYAVHMLIQQKVGGGDAAEAQVALLMQARSEMIESLKSVGLTVSTAVKPYRPAVMTAVRSANEGPYDLLRLERMGCFYSDTVLTWKAAV